MADHTISISNAINSFGPAPSTKWGTGTLYNMTWGTSKWGEGTIDLEVAVEKLLTNDITLTGATLTMEVFLLLANSILMTSETENEGLNSSNGYDYLFVGPTTEAEDRNESTYTAASAGATTYTSAAAASTTWS